MGIDYVVDLACEPKKALSTREIVSLLKAPPDEQSEETLDEHAHHCAVCPAQRGRARPAYGCFGSVAYPIPRGAEAWLLSLFPDDLDSTAGQLLVRARGDFDWDGRHAAALRAETGAFFEAGEPGARSWEHAGGRFELSSDQVFEMLFPAGPLDPAHAAMLCLFLGVLPHDLDPGELSGALAGRARMASLLSRRALPGESERGAGGVRGFVDALKTSAALGVTLQVER